MITKEFKKILAKSVAGSSYTAPSYIAWGDDNTLPTEDDTALGNELERNVKDTTIVTGTSVEITGILKTTDLIGSTINEIGLLDSSTGGTLFIRDIFDDIEKTGNFEIDTNFIITFL